MFLILTNSNGTSITVNTKYIKFYVTNGSLAIDPNPHATSIHLENNTILTVKETKQQIDETLTNHGKLKTIKPVPKPTKPPLKEINRKNK